ncbi:Crp/Fnr family transcriptional regulator [Deinococcus altitudinis]|uniref:Crp/Fnr family transcriptional regulator n=1 Tax=Deinococcus altitudinis TaxID=468914 RepID=UPI0038923418
MLRLDDLIDSVLFEGVQQEGVRMALEGSTELTYPAGEILIRQDAQGEALYLLRSGVVRVSRISLGGRMRVLGDLYAPAVLGETAALGSSARSATVTALEEVRTLVIYRDHLERVMTRYPKVLWNLAKLLADRVTQLNDELIAAGISTEASMAQSLSKLYLHRLEAQAAQPEMLPISVTDLSHRLSSSRETAHRLLKRLQVRGLVKILPNSVLILDHRGLEKLLYQLGEE